MFSFSTAALYVLTIAVPNPEAKVEADRRHALELIPKLGHDFFRIREEASRELASLGSAAKEALETGLKHSDMEIRDRCRKLLPKAMELHLNEQIARFLANPTGPLPADLPALKRWTQVVGSDKESFEMYGEIVKKHQKILIDLEASPDQAAERYQGFIRDVYDRSRFATAGVGTTPASTIEPSELTLFLFLGSDANCRKGMAPTNYTYGNLFLTTPYLTQKLSGSTASPIVKKLFAAWLKEEDTPTLISRGFRLAAQYDVKECVPAALKTSRKTGLNGIYRSYALVSLAKIGTKETVADPEFQKLLTDKSVIRAGVNGAEIRDVALGIAVELTGQKLSDYGFTRSRPNGLIATSYIYYSLGSDENREAAHKKWEEWTAAQNQKK